MAASTGIELGLAESRWVAQQLGRPVVKAFNNIYADHLGTKGKPSGSDDRIALPYAGDDEKAKARVAGLIDELGFEPVDDGTLEESWRQQPGTLVYGTDHDKLGVRKALEAAQPAAQAGMEGHQPQSRNPRKAGLRVAFCRTHGHWPRVTGCVQDRTSAFAGARVEVGLDQQPVEQRRSGSLVAGYHAPEVLAGVARLESGRVRLVQRIERSAGQRTGAPGLAPWSASSRKRSLPPSPAERIIPSDSPKRIFRGARLAMNTTLRPTSFSGSA